jgi:hypothetical protein
LQENLIYLLKKKALRPQLFISLYYGAREKEQAIKLLQRCLKLNAKNVENFLCAILKSDISLIEFDFLIIATL